MKWQKITEQNLEYESSNQYSYEFKMPASGIVTLQTISECDTEHIKQIWFFTAEEFKKRFIKALYDAMKAFKIDSKNDRAGFLANVEHETQGFNKIPIENDKFSLENWRKMAKSKRPQKNIKKWLEEHKDNQEQDFSKLSNVDKLNIMYRGINGNKDLSDGWIFRGRGIMQLTGRENYHRFADYAKRQDIMENPDLVATDPYLAALSAAWFWKVYHKNSNAQFLKSGNFKAIRETVNGGIHGMNEATELYHKYLKNNGAIPLHRKK